MTDEKNRHGEPAGGRPKNARQDRLKLALRENLKRRKSQARGRAEAPSDIADAALDDASGKRDT